MVPIAFRTTEPSLSRDLRRRDVTLTINDGPACYTQRSVNLSELNNKL